jgi:hypothetical protein
MADIDLVIKVTGAREVERLTETFNRSGQAASKTAGNYDVFATAITRQLKANTQLAALQKQLNKAVEDGSTTRLRANRILRQAVRDANDYVKTDKILLEQMKQRRRAEENQIRLDAQAASEKEKLTLKYRPLYAASKQYERALAEIARAQAVGAINTEQARIAIQRLDKEYSDFAAGIVVAGNQFGRFDAAAYRSAQNMRRFGAHAIQQVGYQVGDFAVQIQGGTDALVALGQQGAQLLGIFGAAGAIAGAGLAVTTALAKVALDYYRAANGIKTYDDAIKDINKSFDDYLEIVDLSQKSTQDLTQIFGSTTEQMRSTIRVLDELRFDKTLKDISALKKVFSTKAGDEFFGSIFRAQDTSTSNRGQRYASLAVKRLKEDFGATVIEAVNLSDAIKNMDKAESLKEAYDNVSNIQDMFLELYGTADKVPEAFKDFFASLADTNKMLGEMVGKTEEILDLQNTPMVPVSNPRAVATYEISNMIAEEQQLLDLSREQARFQEVRKTVIERLGQAAKFASAQQLDAAAADIISIQDAIDKKERLKNVLAETTVQAYKLRDAFKEIAAAELTGANRLAVLRDQVAAAKGGRSVAAAGAMREMALSLSGSGLGVDAIAKAVQAAGATAKETEALTKELEDLQRPAKTDRATKGKVYDLKGEKDFPVPIRRPTDAAVDELKKLVDKRSELLTMTKEEIHFAKIYSDVEEALTAKKLTATEAQKMATAEAIIAAERAIEQQQTLDGIAGTISQSFGDAFMSIVDGTKSAGDAFKNMASVILKELFRIMVVEQLVKSVGAAISGGFSAGVAGGATGGASGLGGASSGLRGDGFRAAGGSALPGQTLMVGERGPELINMGSNRGTVVNANQSANSMSGETINQTINFNLSANGDASVKQMIAQAAPQIAALAKSSLMSDRQRGGATKRTFGG